MFEYNEDYFNMSAQHPCNGNIGTLKDNQIVASPNELIDEIV